MGAAKRLRWCSGTCPRSPILLPLTIQAHPADPKSIDHRPPRPSASRRLVRTTPHLPMQPLGHSAARPLDATGVATLHRQRSMVKVPFGRAPARFLRLLGARLAALDGVHSQEEAGAQGAQPLLRVLELAASTASHFHRL